jgi:hypothetical protein
VQNPERLLQTYQNIKSFNQDYVEWMNAVSLELTKHNGVVKHIENQPLRSAGQEHTKVEEEQSDAMTYYELPQPSGK